MKVISPPRTIPVNWFLLSDQGNYLKTYKPEKAKRSWVILILYQGIGKNPGIAIIFYCIWGEIEGGEISISC